MKRFVALARVSSREQEREGFSLDVQEEALRRYAEREGGEIVQLYRIAETASKQGERRTFKEMLAYCRRNGPKLDAVLFYKIDRAARNLFDYVELERLEVEHGVPAVYVTQPTQNTPAGRMMRRTLANMASFYTEQQSLDVKEGWARRVQDGLFVGKAPYGYQNVRIDGRSLVEIHPVHGQTVRRIFELYAYHCHTLDGCIAALEAEGAVFTDESPKFVRSKVYSILRDRAYIGEIRYQDAWYPGQHEPLVDLATFSRVQTLLGEKVYTSHESVYGSGMITCGHCDRPVVVEIKTKKSKKGLREYRYYRCAGYTAKGHPRVRVREAELDEQLLDAFRRLKVPSRAIHEWAVKVIHAKTRSLQKQKADVTAKLQHQLRSTQGQQDRLLNLRLLDEIDAETFARKRAELQGRADELKLQLEAHDRQREENADLAIRAFELSQSLTEKWLAADIAEKRQILEIVCLNLRLDGASLSVTMRKPFDVFAEGPILSQSRGGRIWTYPSLPAGFIRAYNPPQYHRAGNRKVGSLGNLMIGSLPRSACWSRDRAFGRSCTSEGSPQPCHASLAPHERHWRLERPRLP